MKNLNLFEETIKFKSPLADQLRPKKIEEVIGQKEILNEESVLFNAIKNDKIFSFIMWGPPGSGKTSIANAIANATNNHFEIISAALSGVSDLKKAFNIAKIQQSYNKKTIIFIDEIHRFNKSQQDILLPYIENGTIILIGATTENPSFAINAALLSRLTIFKLSELSHEEIVHLLNKAASILKPQYKDLNIKDEALSFLAENCQGDARRALNILEVSFNLITQQQTDNQLSIDIIEKALASKTMIHDKHGEAHYNTISAFIKSMRGSDPDASIYWMMRLLEAGEDPLFILRRMIIFASEDIGNADPNALNIAVSADQAFQRLGMPEGIYPLSQCCLYLATAPKSNDCYKAWKSAQIDVKKYGSLEVPLKLRNPVTKYMQKIGYGKDYRYPHNEGGFIENETYLPNELIGKKYYDQS